MILISEFMNLEIRIISSCSFLNSEFHFDKLLIGNFYFYFYEYDFFAKFNIWPPYLVFVMDDWTSHKQLTAIYACVCMCASIQAFQFFPNEFGKLGKFA